MTDAQFRALLVRVNILERKLGNFIGGGATVTPHASQHEDGGSDPLDVKDLAGYPGGTTTFLRGDATFAAPSGSGGLDLLEQHTASSSATLDFTSWLSGSYDVYIFHLVNILPATDNVDLNALADSDGGASYDTGTNYDFAINLHLTGLDFTQARGTTGTAFSLAGNIENTAADGGISGVITLFNPGSTTHYKNVLFDGTFAHSSVGWGYTRRGFRWRNAAALNAVRFQMTSGNIASGTIRVYGVVNS